MAYNNGAPFDKDAHYAHMSVPQLEKLVATWKEAVAKFPQHKLFNEELGIVQMKLAERIGKK